MTEIFVVLAVCVLGFFLLFLVFILKSRSTNESKSLPTCQTCNCHKKELLEKEKNRLPETLMSEAEK